MVLFLNLRLLPPPPAAAAVDTTASGVLVAPACRGREGGDARLPSGEESSRTGDAVSAGDGVVASFSPAQNKITQLIIKMNV